LASGTVLSPSEFFAGLRKGLKTRLPLALRNFNSARGRGRLMKLHYGFPELHFEAWHHTGAGRLEVGLHFEGTAAQNRSVFDFFRRNVLEIKERLPHAELEPWDRGWYRIYETLPAPQLDDRVLDLAAGRLTAYIETLEPLLESWSRE
jgi:hypothetical protein